jgi:hypothetical protein
MKPLKIKMKFEADIPLSKLAILIDIVFCMPTSKWLQETLLVKKFVILR